ncbi:MAG: IS3 family transposase [Nitrospirota bacterium]
MVQKKTGSLSREEKRFWIDSGNEVLSVNRQCDLLGLARSSWYYEPVAMGSEDVTLMNLIDAQYTDTPFYGSRKMVVSLRHLGYGVSRKRVQRLMRLMGIAGVCPGPNTSERRMEHAIYPYLLRGFMITRPNQIWSWDISVPQQAA